MIIFQNRLCTTLRLPVGLLASPSSSFQSLQQRLQTEVGRREAPAYRNTAEVILAAMTGHEEGVIAIRAGEADDITRELNELVGIYNPMTSKLAQSQTPRPAWQCKMASFIDKYCACSCFPAAITLMRLKVRRQ